MYTQLVIHCGLLVINSTIACTGRLQSCSLWALTYTLARSLNCYMRAYTKCMVQLDLNSRMHTCAIARARHEHRNIFYVLVCAQETDDVCIIARANLKNACMQHVYRIICYMLLCVWNIDEVRMYELSVPSCDEGSKVYIRCMSLINRTSAYACVFIASHDWNTTIK